MKVRGRDGRGIGVKYASEERRFSEKPETHRGTQNVVRFLTGKEVCFIASGAIAAPA
jgi:hypothetical protein